MAALGCRAKGCTGRAVAEVGVEVEVEEAVAASAAAPCVGVPEKKREEKEPEGVVEEKAWPAG